MIRSGAVEGLPRLWRGGIPVLAEWSRRSSEGHTAEWLRRNDIGPFMRRVNTDLMNSPG